MKGLTLANGKEHSIVDNSIHEIANNFRDFRRRRVRAVGAVQRQLRLQLQRCALQRWGRHRQQWIQVSDSIE